MTAARALHVLANCQKLKDGSFIGFTQGDITPDEDKFIRMVWTLMDDSTSYYDAVVAIAKGL